MSSTFKVCLAFLTLCALAAPAWADWNPTDPYKMHYPQLPNPNGWDVDITTLFVADDWMCSESGPVTDIHFWLSAKSDLGVGNQNLVWARIYSDIPDPDGTGPLFSQPNRSDLLFDRIFNPGQYVVTPPESGQQGWYTPGGPEYAVIPQDHSLFWQINITNIVDPLIQQQGSIYWLELHVTPPTGFPQARYGWKTSLQHWNDDAVWSYDASFSEELRDPFTLQSLDMAFVITPEPTSLVSALVGLMIVVRRARR